MNKKSEKETKKDMLKEISERVLRRVGMWYDKVEIEEPSLPTESDYHVEIEFHTKAGEDFLIELSIPSDSDDLSSDFADAMQSYADDFDVDEYVEPLIPFRGKHGVPESISELVHDAEDTKKLLDELAFAAKFEAMHDIDMDRAEA